MAKSIIVYGVPGGKTRFAQRIADHFGICLVVQNFSGFPLCKASTLFITDATSVPSNYAKISRSLQSVADEINATISLTDWQSGPPPMVGEWIASVEKDRNVRRWWNGKRWSVFYLTSMPQGRRNDRSSRPCIEQEQGSVKWRGLSSEPIKVTE